MELITRIKSDDLTSYFSKFLSWDLSEKISHNITLNTSSFVISFSAIDIPKVICITGDNPFKINISTATESLTMGVDDGLFLLTPTLAFANSITQLLVSEDAGLDCAIEIRVYGVEAS